MTILVVTEPTGIKEDGGKHFLLDSEVEVGKDIDERTAKRWMKAGWCYDKDTGERGQRSLAPVKLDVHSIG